MTKSLLGDAFDHHVWATLRVIDACLELSPELWDFGEQDGRIIQVRATS